MRCLRMSICIICLSMVAFSVAYAAEGVPTNIRSERMTYDANKQNIVFEGKVVVTRPDFQLTSKRLTVILAKKKSGNRSATNSSNPVSDSMSAGEVERLIAEQDVRMVSEGRVGRCSTATYTVADGVLLMEGNPILEDGSNNIRGKIIKFYTESNRSEVIGGVEADFTSTDKPQSSAIEIGQ